MRPLTWFGLGVAALCLTACSTQQVAYRDDLQQQTFLIDSLRTELADASRAARSAASELSLMQERLDRQEETIQHLATKHELQGAIRNVDERLATLDLRHSQVLTDLRKLAGHSEEKGQTLKAAREEIASLRKELSQQVGNCKQALESVVALVQSDGRTYRVKSGDSLARVAKANSTTVERLKEANGLLSDTIYPDQELVIPRP